MIRLRYIHKYEDNQCYGGPEEGGWWYNHAEPQWHIGIPLISTEEFAFKVCRFLNRRENKRQEKENKYGYTSVLSYEDTFYSYGWEDCMVSEFPALKPHYE
jgi:hypothetical protein